MEDVKSIELQEGLLPRQSWVRSLGDKLHKLFSARKNKTAVVKRRRLPDDIIINILSRLPAQCLLQCRDACQPLRILIETPSFADMHLNRATPDIAFSNGDNYFSSHCRGNFTDEEAKHITTKKIRKWCNCYSGYPILYCSFNGFLLFYYCDTYPSRRNIVCIWNPITQQKVIIVDHMDLPAYRPCGFFVHPPTMEYRVLYVNPQFQFCVYGLIFERYRQIGNFTHPPTNKKPPVCLNGNLHWMVDDQAYKNANNGVKTECSDSILLFNIITETFHTIPHPGNECGLGKKHDKMELMDMEGHLGFCDTRSNTKLDIWILKDYENEYWVKRHVVDLVPVMTFCGIRDSYGSRVDVKNIYMHKKDQLLLKVSDRDLIIYDLKLGTTRRVARHKKGCDKFVAVPHIDSLILI